MLDPVRDFRTPCAKAAVRAYEAREDWLRAARARLPEAHALYLVWLGRQEQLRHLVVRWLRCG